MKFLLTIILICAAFCYAAAGSANEKMKEIVDECKAETGATDDDIAEMFKHKPMTTPEGKCMRFCTLRKSGLINEDRTLNVEKFAKLSEMLSKGDEAKEKAGNEIVQECKDTAIPEDDCDASEAYNDCFREKATAKGLKDINFE